MAKNIHFIGIGGIGNSSLAQILHEKGFKVSGSDSVASNITRTLKHKGIKIFKKHKAEHVNLKVNKIIYSPAIPPNNPELLRAKELKIPCFSYPQALGEFSKDYFTIAISGTHGKSTTTAMTSAIFIKAGLDPTVVIGTKMRELNNRNYRNGDSKYLIIEACEYKKSFLNFKPDILAITNIEADHLDFYKNFSNYKKAFAQIIGKVPKKGLIIINDDKTSKALIKKAKSRVIATRLQIKPGIPGNFNISNASMAAEIALSQKVDIKIIEKALKNYKGSWRRLQHKNKMGNTIFIDDYAHHPTEIRMTLAAIRENYPKAKLLCVFQPHQYGRTKSFLSNFGESFIDADTVIIPNIYSARDGKTDESKVSTDDLVNEINQYSNKARNGNGLKETARYIRENYRDYDLIVTMGAGDIAKIYKLI